MQLKVSCVVQNFCVLKLLRDRDRDRVACEATRVTVTVNWCQGLLNLNWHLQQFNSHRHL